MRHQTHLLIMRFTVFKFVTGLQPAGAPSGSMTESADSLAGFSRQFFVATDFSRW